MGISVLSAYMPVHHMCAGPMEVRRGCLILQEVEGCELPCEYWELNIRPTQEYTVLLPTEPSL